MSDSAIAWIGAYQTPLSMGFFLGKNTGVDCQCLLQYIFNPGIKPVSPVAPALQADSLPWSYQGSPHCNEDWRVMVAFYPRACVVLWKSFPTVAHLVCGERMDCWRQTCWRETRSRLASCHLVPSVLSWPKGTMCPPSSPRSVEEQSGWWPPPVTALWGRLCGRMRFH